MENTNTMTTTNAGDADRVRANTSAEVNARLDREMRERVESYAAKGGTDISRRIEELDREWDFERILEAEAASMGMIGVTLAATVNKKLLALPVMVAGMVLLHSVQGWYPLLPVFRRLNVRTREEIDREKYALKALRGDFEQVSSEPSTSRTDAAARARRAWEAAGL